ncbi:MAG TPA: cellulose biosynthesis protein BcsE [Trinickia sp.]|nr:cellulose biosynthesis protein BcsE [Trinickia sp.]
MSADDSTHAHADTAAAGLRASLRAALRSRVGRRVVETSRLAIDALPDELACLSPGCLYAIYAAPRTPGSEALIWESAREARTRHVTVVLSRPRSEAFARMRELGFAQGAPASRWPRNLNVLAMPAPPVSQASSDDDDRPVPAALGRLIGGLQALKRFGFRSNALYFVEGAERWFSWHDAEALAREGRLLADWCAARRIALVLMLHPGSGAERDTDGDALESDEPLEDDASRPGLREFHGACAGVARLARTHGELLWHVDFWRAGRALVTGEVHSLRFTDGGHLSVVPESTTETRSQTGAWLARDDARVVATRAVVAGEAWVPGDWEIVDDQQAALAACAGAQAATVLVDYTDSGSLEPLCATVHTLRRQCGRALKIVVVERREALRHQYELLLLSLGANLLLGRDVPFSRMQSLMRSLQGQLHTRPIASDYRGALAAALTDAVRGYLPVAAYCERVQGVLKRSALLQLPHVLAKLTLLPGAGHADALRSCVPRRAGDVFTADAKHLYVFLFACRVSDADAALARIFSEPVQRWSDRVVHLAEESIERELKALAEAHRRAPIADYSDLFPEASVQAARGATSAGAKNDERVAAATPDKHAKTSEAAAQLQAVESVLASIREATDHADVDFVDGDSIDAEPADDLLPRTTPRPRYAEPWRMPLRPAEEK